ncbi:NSRP1 protein, partial [Mystacornis crossleyi]|nr:NSRP1 protein [Mystacornis crossleyi]
FFFPSRYGLIMPKKLPQKNLVSKKLSVFADESDEEPTVGESLQREALKKQAMKQTKLEIQKALEEDATVYEYDSIYDEMQQKKKETSAKMLAGNDDKKPRYIHNILKAAEIRKKEQERRMERKIQKEREMEGGEFAHKEAFVTSAYKKKLQERAEEEERERRESALEAYLDVTKQRDLSGFYRHLLNQTVGEEEMPKCSFREARIKEEKPDSQDEPSERSKCPSEGQRVKPSKKENNPDADTDLGTDSSDDDKRHKHSKVDLKKEKRRENSVSSEEEVKHHKSQRHSRSPSSSSVEEEPRTKGQTSHQRGESRPGRRGNDEQYREKDYERSRTHEKDHQREREERHRHGDHTTRDHYRRREDQDDKQRGKERKEREGHDREWRRAKEREEKGSEKEREKDRTRNDKDRYNDREKERGEKYREREDQAKERREKYGSDERKYRERRESTPTSLEKDGETDLGKERKGKDREVGEKGRSSSVVLSEQKRKAGEEGEKEEKEQAQKAPESMSKFAKRSNEETVMSARDRYLARQMARVSTKPYIEKEED